MQPSLHSDLADEDERVERTGPSKLDLDGAVRDGQVLDRYQLQQAAAMVILSDINTNAQQQCSIKEMASKLATSSSSSVAVGRREGRTHHGRARVLAPRRHERREQRDQRHSPARALLVI